MRRWTRSDAWILIAISSAHRKGGATLAEIVGAAEAIKPALPTAGELSRAFSRFVDCGIVRVNNDRYLLARNWQRAVKEIVEGRRGRVSKFDKCLKLLKSAGFKLAQSTTVTVSDSDVRAAFESYRASINDALILIATWEAHKKGGATLAEIIGRADANNKAIPTAGELSRAFSRFVNCGIVQVNNDRYLLARNWQRAVKKVREGKGDLLGSKLDKCLELLISAHPKLAESTTVTVSDADYRAAVESYGAWIKKHYLT
jgi:hypothetical protein